MKNSQFFDYLLYAKGIKIKEKTPEKIERTLMKS
jgi:hypothetical protein